MVLGDCRKTLNAKSARTVLTHGESGQAPAVSPHALSHTHKRLCVLGLIVTIQLATGQYSLAK